MAGTVPVSIENIANGYFAGVDLTCPFSISYFSQV